MGPDQHCLKPHEISEDTYNSKWFLIRYLEEECEVNDLITFRTEVDVSEGYLQTEFYIQLELCYSGMTRLGGPSMWRDKDLLKKADFKMIEQHMFSVKRAMEGLCEHATATFKAPFYSQLDFQLVASMLDFKVRHPQSLASCLFKQSTNRTDEVTVH